MTLRGRLQQALHPRLHYLGGNDVTLLCHGASYFPVLLKAIDDATDSIRLETYLYADDKIGDATTDALCRAAQRGVDVRVVVDGFGARNIEKRHRQRLEQAGAQLRVFRPENQLLRHLLSFRRVHLRRMHRKLVLIDGRTALLGGINIIDDATGNMDDIRFDFAVRVNGPLIGPIAQAIDRQWYLLTRLQRLRHPLSQRNHTDPMPTMPTQLQTAPVGDVRAALALRDNLFQRRTIELAYLHAIHGARSEITLAMAYFIPSQRILAALFDAASHGVQITLLLQGRVEYRLQHYASQSLYARLLAHGIRIVEYCPGFMHAKVAVIDDDWSIIGSANLDPFSLLVALEANIVIRDRRFTQTLRAQLEEAIRAHGREVTPAAWAAQPGHHRLLRDFSARLLYRFLRLTGYAENY